VSASRHAMCWHIGLVNGASSPSCHTTRQTKQILTMGRLSAVARGEHLKRITSPVHFWRILPEVGSATGIGAGLRQSAGLSLVPLPSATEAGQDGSARID